MSTPVQVAREVAKNRHHMRPLRMWLGNDGAAVPVTVLAAVEGQLDEPTDSLVWATALVAALMGCVPELGTNTPIGECLRRAYPDNERSLDLYGRAMVSSDLSGLPRRLRHTVMIGRQTADVTPDWGDLIDDLARLHEGATADSSAIGEAVKMKWARQIWTDGKSYPSQREDARKGRGKRSRNVRLDRDLDDDLAEVLDEVDGRTLADVVRAGVEALKRGG